jgi:hypothetical protein
MIGVNANEKKENEVYAGDGGRRRCQRRTRMPGRDLSEQVPEI